MTKEEFIEKHIKILQKDERFKNYTYDELLPMVEYTYNGLLKLEKEYKKWHKSL